MKAKSIPAKALPTLPVITNDLTADVYDRFITLIADENMSNDQIDIAMEWDIGSTLKQLKRMSKAVSSKESRMVTLRAAELGKKEAFDVYRRGLKAKRTLIDKFGGQTIVDDYETQVKCADRVATLFGEAVSGSSGMTVAVGVSMTISDKEKELLEAYERVPTVRRIVTGGQIG